MGDHYCINNTFAPILNVSWVTDQGFFLCDRWGEMIFVSRTSGEGWNDNMKGSLVQTDVYVWKLFCRDVLTNERIDRIGHVTVVR
jgi:hypothetical protein